MKNNKKNTAATDKKTKDNASEKVNIKNTTDALNTTGVTNKVRARAGKSVPNDDVNVSYEDERRRRR